LASVSYYGHVLRLDDGEERLFEKFDSAVQRAIRKSERAGVTVEISSSLEALRIFYDLHCRTRQKHRLPPQPFSFFECIHRHVLDQGLGFVALARSGGRPVSASVFFHLGTKAIYKFGASDEKAQQLRGNNLVMWEAIKWMARRGLTELNFGRTSATNEGLRRFKQGWGTREYEINCLKYDFGKRQFVSGTDRAVGWHNRVFSLMPIPVSRLVGKILYRHIV
jgi:lipid II:glycine glycyltransferase (peptidoglycan interpeptide bridge formation enzyme)